MSALKSTEPLLASKFVIIQNYSGMIELFSLLMEQSIFIPTWIKINNHYVAHQSQTYKLNGSIILRLRVEYFDFQRVLGM